jgi:hypothetical protein
MAAAQVNTGFSNRWTASRPAQANYTGLPLSSALFFGFWRTRPLYFSDSSFGGSLQVQDDLTFQWEADLSAISVRLTQSKRALILVVFFFLALGFLAPLFSPSLVLCFSSAPSHLLAILWVFFAVLFAFYRALSLPFFLVTGLFLASLGYKPHVRSLPTPASPASFAGAPLLFPSSHLPHFPLVFFSFRASGLLGFSSPISCPLPSPSFLNNSLNFFSAYSPLFSSPSAPSQVLFTSTSLFRGP